jgi:menaquinone reductase, multiheme cytochrome c subunit
MPVKRTIFLIGTPFIIVLVIAFVISQKACNYVMANHPEKPVHFDHKAHINDYGIGSDCTMCHGYYDNGRFKGLPTVAECTGCHDRQGPEKGKGDGSTPIKISEFEKLKDTDKPWGSFAKQPGLVYFSHKVVMSAKTEDGKEKVSCVSCHGDKANSTNTKMLSGKMLMGECEKCHGAMNISNKCAVCHK